MYEYIRCDCRRLINIDIPWRMKWILLKTLPNYLHSNEKHRKDLRRTTMLWIWTKKFALCSVIYFLKQLVRIFIWTIFAVISSGIEVIMDTVKATLFVYYPLLDVALLLPHVSVQFSNHLQVIESRNRRATYNKAHYTKSVALTVFIITSITRATVCWTLVWKSSEIFRWESSDIPEEHIA
jgi:hypothetical protein